MKELLDFVRNLFIKTVDENQEVIDLENEVLEKEKDILALHTKIEKLQLDNDSLASHIKELLPKGSVGLELFKDGLKEFKWVNKDLSIVRSFKINEFMQNDGLEYLKLDMRVVSAIQMIRDYFGKPITVTSAYRGVAYNKEIGGASKSQHLLGKAIDFKVSGIAPSKVQAFIKSDWKKLGITGLGIYSTFTHIDVRSGSSLVTFKWKSYYSIIEMLEKLDYIIKDTAL